VANQGSQRYYIQVAYDMSSEEKQTQELNSLRNIPDSFKKIVIMNGTKKLKIFCLPLYGKILHKIYIWYSMLR